MEETVGKRCTLMRFRNVVTSRSYSTWFLFWLLMILSPQAYSVTGITYTGRILDADDQPVVANQVYFKSVIYDENSHCWLYQEERQLDLSTSSGTFSFNIGSNDPDLVGGTASYNNGLTSLTDVFNNARSLAGLVGCSSPNSYTPATISPRILMVLFRIGSGAQQALPPLKINPVPSALQAYSVNGYGSGELLKVDPAQLALSSVPNNALNQAQYEEFWNLILGTSLAYLKPSSTFGGDVSGTYNAISVDKIKGKSVDTTGIAVNKILKYDGTKWVMGDDNTGGSPGNASTSALGLMQAGSGLKDNGNGDGIISVDVGAVTGKIVQVQAGNKLPALDGSQLTNVVAASIGNNSIGSANIIDGSIIDADINDVAWSKITSKPTTLSGYSITDAVKNNGAAPSLATGTDAALPASGTTTGELYVAYDTGKIYRWSGAAWAVVATKDGSLDATKLPLAGGTMSGDLNTQNITMAANKYFTLSANSTNGSSAGQMWYDSGIIKYYDGSAVKSLGVAGAGITNLNGLSTNTQSFVIGSAGNAPAITSSGSAHTFDFPMASASGSVTAGLISNADYTAMMNKQGSGLNSTKVWVGNASNVAEARALSGDVTIDNVGLVTANKTTTGQSNKLLSLDGSSVGTMNGLALVNTGTVTISAQTASATYGLRLPAAAPANNQILQSNSSGDLSWVSNVPTVNNGASLAAGKIWIGNASGIAVENTMSGDATIDNAGLLTLKNTGTVGTYFKVTTDAQGRVSSGAALLSADVTSALGYTPTAAGAGYINGGNSFAGNATIGLNDAYNLGFETGGTTKMTITSAGNVGIGTASPQYLLDVNGTTHQTGAAAFENAAASNSGPTFSFWKSRNYAAVQSGDELGFISFYGHDGTGVYRSAYVAGYADAAPASGTHTVQGRLTFNTTAAGASDSTERMRIDSSGNVGIGQTSPGSLLHITDSNRAVGSAQANVQIQSSTTGIDNGGNLVFSGEDGAVSGRMFASIAGRKENATSGNYAGYFQIATRADGGSLTERMRVTSTGQVKIAGQLVAANATSNGASLSFDFNNGNVQYTSSACGAVTLSNMLDGASYSVGIKNTSGTCSFTSSGDTVHYAGGVANVTITSHTIFTFLKMGTDVYVTWVTF